VGALHSVVVGILVFAFTFGGALAGMTIGPRLPSAHLQDETRRVVRLGTALIATLTGLVLGLLVSTANGEFNTASTEVKVISAKVVMLDHVLGRYGAETGPIRAELRQYVEVKIEQVWSGRHRHVLETAAGDRLEATFDRLNELSPTSAVQRGLKARAIELADDITKSRWMLIEGNAGDVIPRPFIAIITFWLTVLFMSFGLFGRRNTTSVVAMAICALSVATALFLVIELSRPFGGVITVSDAAPRNALAHMGRE
jgi:hypothetical protein